MRIATLVLMLGGALAAQRVVSTPPPATPEQKAQRFVRQLELPARCSEAWRGLLELGPVAAIPLATATADPRPEVAMRAFHVLALLRADGEPALPRLREHLAGKDPQLAAAAAWAIDRIEFRGRLLADYQTGTVEHLDAAGAVVSTFPNLRGPWHAEPVGNGAVLVSEFAGNCVREFDRLGKEVWKFADLKIPSCAQRLPAGHTLISDAGNNRVIEIDRAGKVVWERKELRRPVAAVRTPDGHTLIGLQGGVLEVDEQDNVIWQVEVGAPVAMRAQRLNNGNTLIAVHADNQVVELGPDAKEAGKPIEAMQAQAALRRRDGHTLIAATTHWLELDATGKEIWRRKGKFAAGIFW